MIRTIVAAALFSALVPSSWADPCADVERVRKVLEAGFDTEKTRKEGPLEYLDGAMFGDDACTITRPWAVSSKRRILCTLADYSGGKSEMLKHAEAHFSRIATTLETCLRTHASFDNKAAEDPEDEIMARRHYRSNDGRETWALTAENEDLPSVYLRIDYETDAAEAKKYAVLPEFLQNVLAAKSCDLYRDMEALARSNFTGVETKRVRTEWAMVKPLDGADECLIARDGLRKENLIACTWSKESAEHAKWAADVQAIRLQGARMCRKGWAETQKTYEIEFANPSGDKLSVGKRIGPDVSVTGVALTIKTAP